MELKIAPSVLAADFGRLRAEVEAVDDADYLHLDIMDGQFVPNISFGPLLIAAIRDDSRLIFDTHLMIANPEHYIEEFASSGSDIITVHVETTAHLHRLLQRIRECGVTAGVALNPATPLAAVREVLPLIDHLLFMTVNPGFGGQDFLPEVLPKMERAADIREREGLSFAIAVDGGINSETARQVVAAGARVLVSGSTIFGANDRGAVIADLRAAVDDLL